MTKQGHYRRPSLFIMYRDHHLRVSKILSSFFTSSSLHYWNSLLLMCSLPLACAQIKVADMQNWKNDGLIQRVAVFFTKTLWMFQNNHFLPTKHYFLSAQIFFSFNFIRTSTQFEITKLDNREHGIRVLQKQYKTNKNPLSEDFPLPELIWRWNYKL